MPATPAPEDGRHPTRRREKITRTRRELKILPDSWKQAGDLAEDSRLTAARALEMLLDAYVSGDVTVEIAPEASRSGRGRVPVTLDDAVWKSAEERAAADGFASVSEVCDALLTGYTEGKIKLQIRVTGKVKIRL
ncbi:hypothetical protein ACIPRL_07910 [Streptomyces sp. NPDC090085]|uniref:hypothetical protein n=1 Tax=Streptomyces sp. NPDC090085 TaxID=3365943 RepID=UPI00380CFAF0